MNLWFLSSPLTAPCRKWNLVKTELLKQHGDVHQRRPSGDELFGLVLSFCFRKRLIELIFQVEKRHVPSVTVNMNKNSCFKCQRVFSHLAFSLSLSLSDSLEQTDMERWIIRSFIAFSSDLQFSSVDFFSHEKSIEPCWTISHLSKRSRKRKNGTCKIIEKTCSTHSDILAGHVLYTLLLLLRPVPLLCNVLYVSLYFDQHPSHPCKIYTPFPPAWDVVSWKLDQQSIVDRAFQASKHNAVLVFSFLFMTGWRKENVNRVVCYVTLHPWILIRLHTPQERQRAGERETERYTCLLTSAFRSLFPFYRISIWKETRRKDIFIYHRRV